MVRNAKVVNMKAYKRIKKRRKMKKYGQWFLPIALLLTVVWVCYVFVDQLQSPGTMADSKAMKKNYQNYQQMVVDMSNSEP